MWGSDSQITEMLLPSLRMLGFIDGEWDVDVSDPVHEGHLYEFNDILYEEESGIYVTNRNNRDDVFSLWVDYAWVEGMHEPLLFVESISSQGNIDLFKKYKISYIPYPESYLKSKLTSAQYQELLKEYHFKEGKHLTLWDEEEYKKYNSN